MKAYESLATFNAAERAEQFTADCFFNSLLRERSEIAVVALPPPLAALSGCREGVKVDSATGDGRTLWAAIRSGSQLGRHRYAWPLYFMKDTAAIEVAKFGAWVPWVAETLARRWNLPAGSEAPFVDRVFESWAAIEAGLAHRVTTIWEKEARQLNFLRAEQGLLVGHSFHPTPRSRRGWGAQEQARYCPEMGGAFRLHWFLVRPEAWVEKISQAWTEESPFIKLAHSDADVAAVLRDYEERGMRALPMHPWQAQYLSSLPAVQDLCAEGSLVDLGPQGPLWKATSSLRSVFAEAAPFMLKFSLSVRVTNSVRNLLTHEVERGLQVHEVFATRAGRELLERYPDFRLLYEPAYAALRGRDGSIIKESIVVTRENPFFAAAAPEALVLATLTEDDPLGRGTWISRQIASRSQRTGENRSELSQKWFLRYCERIVEPLLMAQADYGILLGAHQQNILIGFEDELPARLLFRDCQGTGYTLLGYELLSPEVASLTLDNGNVLSAEKGNALVSYYLIINATFNVIYALAEAGGLAEDELIDLLRGFLLGLRGRKPRDSSLIDALLEQDYLLHKGNFFCSLSGLNENTAADPLAIYKKIPNPLFRKGVNL